MKYDTKEELDATDQWFLNMAEAGVSEELLFVPSELSKLGVAPKDVADQLDWLRTHRPGFDQPTAVLAVLRGTARVEVQDAQNETVFEDRQVDVVVGESEILVLDYDGETAWEWLRPLDELVEGSILNTLTEEPGLASFNSLVAMLRSQPQEVEEPEPVSDPEPEQIPDPESRPTPAQGRTRGKLARAARLSKDS